VRAFLQLASAACNRAGSSQQAGRHVYAHWHPCTSGTMILEDIDDLTVMKIEVAWLNVVAEK